jgi:hypothetical protein
VNEFDTLPTKKEGFMFHVVLSRLLAYPLEMIVCGLWSMWSIHDGGTIDVLFVVGLMKVVFERF